MDWTVRQHWPRSHQATRLIGLIPVMATHRTRSQYVQVRPPSALARTATSSPEAVLNGCVSVSGAISSRLTISPVQPLSPWAAPNSTRCSRSGWSHPDRRQPQRLYACKIDLHTFGPLCKFVDDACNRDGLALDMRYSKGASSRQ